MFVLVININSTKLILFSLERELVYIFFVQQHLGVILPVTGGQDTLSVGIYRADPLPLLGNTKHLVAPTHTK